MADSKTFSPDIMRLFDGYVHGQLSRREFIDRAAAFTASTVTAAAILEALSPDYALAEQVAPDDESIVAGFEDYASPDGAGEMKAYVVKPADANGAIPAVVVIHENRGLNPYVQDVARRVAKAGYLAFAPDALAPLGGYPGNDDEGRVMQRQRDREEMLADFVAAVKTAQNREDCTGKVACVGFCFGGWVSNQLAVKIPDLAGAVPYYGGQPAAEDVASIHAPLQIHHGGLDERVNAGWPAYKAALEAAGKDYTEYTYENANHGFHNDTTPRYDQAAAELAWSRTLEFFAGVLV